MTETLLPEFLEAEPKRKSLEETTDEDIAKAVRGRLERLDQRNVDTFIDELLTKKDDDDDDDTRGMKNLTSLREALTVQLRKEGREVISGDELAGMLNDRQLSDMLREHVIHRR